jgi:hypothetical protein
MLKNMSIIIIISSSNNNNATAATTTTTTTTTTTVSVSSQHKLQPPLHFSRTSSTSQHQMETWQ